MTTQWVPRITIQQAVTSSITTSAGAYSANDQVGSVITLPSVVRYEKSSGIGTAILTSIVVVDQAAQTSAMDIFFFNASPTVASSDNAALNISDAEMTSKCIGYASVSTFSTTSANSVGAATNLNLPVWTAADSSSIYAIIKTTGTPTYGSGTGILTVRFNFLVD